MYLDSATYELLKYGDVIWARRYNNQEEMEHISPGHRQGPYVVLEKKNDKLVCLFCSSKFDKTNKKLNFKLTDKSLDLNCDTYVHLTKIEILDRNSVIKKISSLSEEDDKKLLRKLDIMRYDKVIGNAAYNVSLEPGDIIFYKNNKYLIIGETANEYNLFSITDTIKDDSTTIYVDNQKYNILLDTVECIQKDKTIRRMGFIDNDTLNFILAKYAKREEYLKKQNTISLGTLIMINDKYYYIYKELDDRFIGFLVEKEESSDKSKIMINNIIYYSNFLTELELQKKDPNIKWVVNANQKEQVYILEKSKKYKHHKKDSTKLVNKPSVIMGKIVEYNEVLYIVLCREDDEIITVLYDDFLTKNYTQLFKFNVSDVCCVRTISAVDLKNILIQIKDISCEYIDAKKNKKLLKMIII